MMETTGYYLNKWEDAQDPTPEQELSIKSFEEDISQKRVSDKAREIFTESAGVLNQPFAFYSFGVSINAE